MRGPISSLLKDPLYRPSPDVHRMLEDDVRSDVLRQQRVLTSQERRVLSDKLAMAATTLLLKQLEPTYKVVDANIIRRNHPGFDFLIDDKIRVQVKGATYVEGFGWPVSREASLDFDVLVWVDVGVTLNGNVGRLATVNLPVKPHADFYIVPIAVIRQWLARTQAINGRGTNIYLWKRPLKPGSKEEREQTRDLANWVGRFDVIEGLLLPPSG
jgi:hypothetical protein